MNDPAYQREIDGLRAVAVVAVILHHYWPDLFPGGFVGVDVFFVISGYVITLQLRRSRDIGWSEYLFNFYSRRIKRLLPALLVCVVVTSAAFVLLTTRPQGEVFKTGSFALAGASNLYLLHRASDYFSLQAQLNPFTHTWTLGVEEQFYAVFPFLLAIVGFSRVKRAGGVARAATMLCILSLLSLVAYVAWSIGRPLAAFYLMPTRFWELGLGSLIAIGAGSGLPRRLPQGIESILCIVAVIALVAVCCTSTLSPTVATICSVAAASLLVVALRSGGMVFRLLSSAPVVQVGLLSYSLYLWHWSVLVLAKWTIGVGPWSIPALLILTVALAAGSYRFVERPLRYATWSSSSFRTIVYALIVTIPLAVINATAIPRLAATYNDTLPRLVGVPEVPAQLLPECDIDNEDAATRAKAFASCLHADRTAAKPRALYLVGDSHAAQLVVMAKAAVEGTAFQFRFLNLGDWSDFPVGLINGENRKAPTLDYILQNSVRGDLVAVSFHRGLLNESRDLHVPLTRQVGLDDKAGRFVENMRPYVAAFASRGVKVILVRDTPLMGAVATSPSCLLQIKLLGESICRIHKAQDLHTRRRQDLSFDALGVAQGNVVTWDPLPYVYGGRDSLDVVDEAGRYVMWDWNHITARQSELLAAPFRQFLVNVAAD